MFDSQTTCLSFLTVCHFGFASVSPTWSSRLRCELRSLGHRDPGMGRRLRGGGGLLLQLVGDPELAAAAEKVSFRLHNALWL